MQLRIALWIGLVKVTKLRISTRCADELADEESITPATRLLTFGLCSVASSFAVAKH